MGQDEASAAIQRSQNVLLFGHSHEGLNRDFGADDPAVVGGGHLLEDGGAIHLQGDDAAGLFSPQQLGHDRARDDVFDARPGFIHQIKLFAADVELGPHVPLHGGGQFPQHGQAFLPFAGRAGQQLGFGTGVQAHHIHQQMLQQGVQHIHGGAVRVIHGDGEAPLLDMLAHQRIQKRPGIAFFYIHSIFDGPDFIHLHPAEILPEEEPLHLPLFGPTQVESAMVDESDINHLPIVGRDAHMHARVGVGGAGEVAGHGDGLGAQIQHLHARGGQPRDDSPF